ncbi:MAG TPA: orotidine-5'-phosphate decarboxylase [Methylophaga aminisulfidivorans]|jgi:orotidine-5'-phosphate decarboxylase|uniref:orotidine-5'-phosphate decarboxylase n=1 Tax=Methylophaga TaxID=40222 RepID=UPI00176AD5A5|nr:MULTISPECIES: orotidine-5'-phosphate decarboxylase [Methylophaga]HIC46532.1 orotidine-5'-phosphate decarboxylase [Methylophaga sp.]HIM38679.1 orotidine-5'-phosphate decarboxylase [Methylophaga aminisulfidivorans]
MSDPRIIVALDYATANDALQMADQIDPKRARVKVGKELFTRSGPSVVTDLVSRGFDVFLDLKYHDIPHTVAKACAAAADLGVWMLNVHTLGGAAMMEAAREAVDSASTQPILIGVTLLTSMDQTTFEQIGLSGNMSDTVIRLAKMAKSSGLDGVVCSAQEASALRENLGEAFQLITPGIRPAGSDVGDQHRIMTPKQAIEAGSHYLVIGRPITAASDPMQALADIEKSLL